MIRELEMNEKRYQIFILEKRRMKELQKKGKTEFVQMQTKEGKLR